MNFGYEQTVPTPTNFETARQARLLHELDAHDRVLVEEAARVLAVGADAADDGGQVDDQVRMAVVERPPDAVRRAQVVLGAARHEDVRRASRLESRDDARAQEAGAARDHHAATHPEVGRHARSKQGGDESVRLAQCGVPTKIPLGIGPACLPQSYHEVRVASQLRQRAEERLGHARVDSQRRAGSARARPRSSRLLARRPRSVGPPPRMTSACWAATCRRPSLAPTAGARPRLPGRPRSWPPERDRRIRACRRRHPQPRGRRADGRRP